MKNKIILTLIFGMFLLSLVTASTNVSIRYGQNSTGGINPMRISDEDNKLMVDINLLNLTAGDLTLTGDITLGQKITFALGEIIDNIVDGWIRITGNLNVTENIISQGNITANYFFGNGSQLTDLPSGGNLSWNETYADTLYVNIDGDTITGDLNVTGLVNISHSDPNENFYGYNGPFNTCYNYSSGEGFELLNTSLINWAACSE